MYAFSRKASRDTVFSRGSVVGLEYFRCFGGFFCENLNQRPHFNHVATRPNAPLLHVAAQVLISERNIFRKKKKKKGCGDIA